MSMISFVSSFPCRLYGMHRPILNTELIEIYNESSYHRVLDIGDSVIFQSPAATSKINNRTFISTYNTYDSKAIPYFFMLIIDIETKSIKLNLSLIEKHDSSVFFHIAAADNDGGIFGVRQSVGHGLSLEVAKINLTTGLMTSVGIYPAGTFNFDMLLASKRRLYYNIIDSTLYAINIDTGKLDLHIPIPSDYSIFMLDYDSTYDRLLSLVSSSAAGDALFLAQVNITEKHEIKFDRLGKSEIPWGKYYWSSTYTINTNKRVWITLWDTKDLNISYFIVFNIDNGNIIEERKTNLKYLNNLVCFD